MTFGAASYALGLLAGVLSTLSPCVLPLVPILLASAGAAHRLGPLALAAGLAVSFAALGTAIASAGSALGFGQDTLRLAGAAILALVGLLLLSAGMQRRLAAASAKLNAAGASWLSRLTPTGAGGQFALGGLLGLVWTPCVGPTLGAAIALASQGHDLPQTALLMSLFGFGAALPLAVVGLLSRTAFVRLRGRMQHAGAVGKVLLGVSLLLLAALIVSGRDHALEAWVVDHGPSWLSELTTRY
ncbi:MAG TPA: cytochrome c biogenesis CcdA family protein [Burkholderiaceae bacterium]|nr:cytochrome c biogenesis CcdA family protein [Burkholderiaceae bacterium]